MRVLEESGGRRKKKEEHVEGCMLRKFRTDYGYWFYSSNKKKFRKGAAWLGCSCTRGAAAAAAQLTRQAAAVGVFRYYLNWNGAVAVGSSTWPHVKRGSPNFTPFDAVFQL